MNFEKKRDPFFDFLKAFAIFLVINDHFVGSFADQYYRIVPFKQLFDIFYGKFGVSLFAIISGYFAFLTGGKKEDTAVYALKRYLFFFLSGFVTNILYFLTNMNNLRNNVGLGMTIGQALFLGDYFCPSFWFLKDFLLGSLLSFLLGKNKGNLADCLVVACLVFLCGQVFVASVIMGSILCHTLKYEKEFPFSVLMKILFLVVLIMPVVYRIESADLRYSFNTLRAFAFIALLRDAKFIKKIADHRITTVFGSMTMPILTAHLLATVLLIKTDINVPIYVLYLIWLTLSVLLSLPVHYMVKKLYIILLGLLLDLKDRIEKKRLLGVN